jgi:DNA-binding FadR family transcriptional regulator
MRIILGVNAIDNYRDTVNEGVAMVKQYIEGLAKDDDTKALVNAVLRLLAKDSTGSIKASRVLQLRKMAEDSGNDVFLEGVRIIEESYQPTTTKRFVRAQYKGENGAWINIPLSMTDVE